MSGPTKVSVRFKRLAITGVLAVAAALAVAPPASASWIQQTTPNPSGTKDADLGGVSCVSATMCIAVGNFTDASGQHPLAEGRSGSTWTVQSVSDPSGATASRLSGVSCVTATACSAVGEYSTAAATLTLAESWNGTSWSMQGTPNPAGATSSSLSSVSCLTANACIAVGQSANGASSALLAESWNGSSWTIQVTPSPGGATSSHMTGVSCVSSTACTAVGSYTNASNVTLTLGEFWNGTIWTIQSTPNPAGSNFSELLSVSCTSSNACTATGDGLAERWNGSSWTLQKIARPQGNTPASLSGVSCFGPKACVAVGGFYNTGAILTLVIEAWNGTGWRVQASPLTASNDSSNLNAVSCRPATACTAVGSFHDAVTGNRTLAEVFTLIWQLLSPAVPAGAIASSFAGVSCASANRCMALGGLEMSGSIFQAFIEAWDGSNWTIQSIPNASTTNLQAVSCTSASACTAVGNTGSGGSIMPLALRWNGTAWSAQSLPSPSGALRSYLLGVSCSSSTSCTAVGLYVDSHQVQRTLAEAWNGATWGIQPTPNPVGTMVQLNGVSCASANRCEVAGYYVSGSYRMLAMGWNGSTWTIQTTPTVTGPNLLNGVSCSSATACTAAGNNGTSQEVALVLRWDGTAWTAQTTPPVPGAKNTFLKQASCPSATSCTVAGEFSNNAGTFMTLAEHWNGSSWSVQSTQNPPGATGSNFAGVSCPTAIACLGVGWYLDASANELPLAEQYS